MERPALPPPRRAPQRVPRRAPRLLLVAAPVVALVVVAALWARWADEGDTIIDYWPTDEPPTEPATPRDPQIVASIESGGGMAEEQPGQGLVFELHDDGAVFTSGDGTFATDRYRLTDAGVTRARELLAGVDLHDGAYGEPTITDMPTTTVYVNLEGEPGEVGVYALADLDDPGGLGLGADQRAVRAELMGVIDDLTALAADAALVAEPPAVYTPDRVDLGFVPSIVDDEEVSGETPPEALPWPLDTPLTDRTLGRDGQRLCATAEGDEVAALTAAMAVERPGAQDLPWSTGAAAGSHQPATVAVHVWGLRPGQPACTDRPAAPDPSEPVQLDVGPLYPVELVDPEAGAGTEAGWDGELPADAFRPAEPLEVYAVAPAMAAAVATDPATGLSTTDLTWYDYRAVVAEVDGTTYVDIEARLTEGIDPTPGEPTTWRARTDLTTTEVTTIQAG